MLNAGGTAFMVIPQSLRRHENHTNFRHLVPGLASLTLLLTSGATARANVYATNVRLNGSATIAALYIPCGRTIISSARGGHGGLYD